VNKDDKKIIVAILAILIIQLMVSISNEYRLHRFETKIEAYFSPLEDVDLPEWEN
jgi:hypothetical protein